MFNVTGGELVIILLVALIVLGPDKLPGAVRKFGQVYGELRRMSQGFQSELRDALDEPLREVRDTMNSVTGGFSTDDSTPADDGQSARLAGPVSPAEHEAAAAAARAAGDELPTAPVVDDDVRMATEQPGAAEPADGEPPQSSERA